MLEDLPAEIRLGLNEARRLAEKKRARLRVQIGDEVLRVLRRWEGGFALEAKGLKRLRGTVDLYDGSRLLMQCLIVASELEGDELICQIKTTTLYAERPPLDFVPDEPAPQGLLPRL